MKGKDREYGFTKFNGPQPVVQSVGLGSKNKREKKYLGKLWRWASTWGRARAKGLVGSPSWWQQVLENSNRWLWLSSILFVGYELNKNCTFPQTEPIGKRWANLSEAMRTVREVSLQTSWWCAPSERWAKWQAQTQAQAMNIHWVTSNFVVVSTKWALSKAMSTMLSIHWGTSNLTNIATSKALSKCPSNQLNRRPVSAIMLQRNLHMMENNIF